MQQLYPRKGVTDMLSMRTINHNQHIVHWYELVVEVHAAGLSFPDLLIMQGKHMMKLEPPYTPGSEVCGRVIGGSGGGFKPGDWCFGATRTGGPKTSKKIAHVTCACAAMPLPSVRRGRCRKMMGCSLWTPFI